MLDLDVEPGVFQCFFGVLDPVGADTGNLHQVRAPTDHQVHRVPAVPRAVGRLLRDHVPFLDVVVEGGARVDGEPCFAQRLLGVVGVLTGVVLDRDRLGAFTDDEADISVPLQRLPRLRLEPDHRSLLGLIAPLTGDVADVERMFLDGPACRRCAHPVQVRHLVPLGSLGDDRVHCAALDNPRSGTGIGGDQAPRRHRLGVGVAGDPQRQPRVGEPVLGGALGEAHHVGCHPEPADPEVPADHPGPDRQGQHHQERDQSPRTPASASCRCARCRRLLRGRGRGVGDHGRRLPRRWRGRCVVGLLVEDLVHVRSWRGRQEHRLRLGLDGAGHLGVDGDGRGEVVGQLRVVGDVVLQGVPDPAQLTEHDVGIGRAQVALPGGRAGDERVQVRREARLPGRRWRYVVVDVFVGDLDRALPGVRLAAGQQLERDHAEGVHVGAGVRRTLGDQLRREVGHGAHQDPARRGGGGSRADRPRETEVGDLDPAQRIQQHVLRFQVPVDDPGLMRRGHRLDETVEQLHRGLRSHRGLGADQVAQRPSALDVLHDQEQQSLVLALVVHRDDAGMAQPRR